MRLNNINNIEPFRVYKIGNMKIYKDSEDDYIWSQYPHEGSFYKLFNHELTYLSITDLLSKGIIEIISTNVFIENK